MRIDGSCRRIALHRVISGGNIPMCSERVAAVVIEVRGTIVMALSRPRFEGAEGF